MVYRPEIQFPTQQGTVPFPGGGQLPVQLQRSVVASPGWLNLYQNNLDQAAESISDFYTANIRQFVNYRRHAHSLGVIENTSGHLDLPGLDIDYDRTNNGENLKLTFYPESAPPQALNLPALDINLDGYVVWLHDGSVTESFDLVLNGFTLLAGYTPADNSAVVVMFGSQAGRNQSLHDSINPMNTKDNGGLTPQVLPPRGNAPNVTNVPAHADEFGYFIFGNLTEGWNDKYNPQDPPYQGDGKSFPARVKIPTVTKIIQFEDTTKSPLVINGKNQLAFQIASGGVNKASTVTTYDVLEAEFYDRGQLRQVQSGWTVTSTDGGVYVNDRPCLWEQDLRDQQCLQLVFDFTQSSKDEPVGPSTFGNVTDPSAATQNQLTLAANYQATLNTYNASVLAADQAVAVDSAVFQLWHVTSIDYGASIPIGAPAGGAYVLVRAIYDPSFPASGTNDQAIADFYAVMSSGLATELANALTSHNANLAAFSAALASATAAANGEIGNHTAREIADANAIFEANVTQENANYAAEVSSLNAVNSATVSAFTDMNTLDQAAAPYSLPTIISFNAAVSTHATDAQNQLTADEATLNNLLANPPAPFTVPPVPFGQPTDGFKQRTGTVGGDGTWSFGPYS